MYQRILVAVDGSATSQRALDEAILLARDQRATLHLVHVVDETPLYRYPVSFGNVDPVLEDWRRAGQDILAQSRAQTEEAGVEVEAELTEAAGEHVPNVLIEAARRTNADLMVLGTHGRHGLHHVIMGSVAEGVIRHATLPVLLLRST